MNVVNLLFKQEMNDEMDEMNDMLCLKLSLLSYICLHFICLILLVPFASFCLALVLLRFLPGSAFTPILSLKLCVVSAFPHTLV